MLTTNLTASTPGRICLFGEHLDYLGLPVIAAAIDRRVALTARPDPNAREFRLHLPDIGQDVIIPFDGNRLPYPADRDYLRSCVNVLLQEGFTFSRGIEATVRGTIPINAGASSSSALIVSWLNVLSQLADAPRHLPPMTLAELAYRAEVLEFGEPGGMMDHFATAVGNVIYLESQRPDGTPAIALEALTPPLGTFVLGDSGEPKDTIGILRRVKLGMLDVVQRIQQSRPDFSLHTAALTDVPEFKDQLTKDEYILLKGTLANRDLLRQAHTQLQTPPTNVPAFDRQLGTLLTEHQTNLRDAQRISTPKIDRMLDAALAAGALGGKINGSGGGGSMFVYAPNGAEAVAEAIDRVGGKAYVVRVADGTTLTTD
ncbi:galactokinase family protein [Fibrella sp. WM1]|uniref:GHMP family kinase ATP-binding protein n=1 Tax=Fibrella musci TaxID=3242485 RepID=UPI003520B06B